MKMIRTLPVHMLTLGCLMTPVLASAGSYGPDEKVLAESRQKAEVSGLLGGAVIGGVLAGPPGAIVFAVFGSLVSDSHSSQMEKKAAMASLDTLENDYVALQQDNLNLQLANQDLERRNFEQAQASTTNSAGFLDTELVLHFKTDSSDIEPHYRAELERFAALVKANPDAVVQLTGYADQRGTSDRNLDLSRHRLQAVEQQLGTMGLEASMLNSTAFGESQPLASDQNPEALFFDRRVVLKATTVGNEHLTQIPE